MLASEISTLVRFPTRKTWSAAWFVIKVRASLRSFRRPKTRQEPKPANEIPEHSASLAGPQYYRRKESMFDAKSISVQFPVTVVRICYLRTTNHRLPGPRGQLSPSRDIRIPQVCKSQDDSVGRSQSPFGYAVRSINDRSCSRKEGERPAFRL
jgi:hypothetical protein